MSESLSFQPKLILVRLGLLFCALLPAMYMAVSAAGILVSTTSYLAHSSIQYEAATLLAEMEQDPYLLETAAWRPARLQDGLSELAAQSFSDYKSWRDDGKVQSVEQVRHALFESVETAYHRVFVLAAGSAWLMVVGCITLLPRARIRLKTILVMIMIYVGAWSMTIFPPAATITALIMLGLYAISVPPKVDGQPVAGWRGRIGRLTTVLSLAASGFMPLGPMLLTVCLIAGAPTIVGQIRSTARPDRAPFEG